MYFLQSFCSDGRRCLLLSAIILSFFSMQAQPFVHPGIDQQSKDLLFLKKMIREDKQPWKDAFVRLKTATDTAFIIKTHTHVLRGPYGKPNIGGDDLSKAANMAYNYALLWYMTGDKKYADKAIAVLNAWSPVLWDLDYNDAKLLTAWTGHLLCNAAEILRYSNAGWQQKDIAAFSNMLMTVYFPLMRPYYPQANGNWDGAIIHSLIAIAVFTDNRKLFNNAVDHFKHAPVNGGILKYIYPNGQCQETPRDQGHVQLGLGEFAGAAQVAYTQGTDLFSMAENRIGIGFNYTAGILFGEKPYCYCTISPRATTLRDDYEYVYRHYAAQGMELPYVKRAADSVRAKASRSVLTAVRAPGNIVAKKTIPLQFADARHVMGAGAVQDTKPPADAILVAPGQSIQQALDAAAGTGKWIVAQAGIHTVPHTLQIPSGITLTGEGAGTILFLDPASGEREAMVNASVDMHDVTIRDLVIEGSNKTDPGTDPNTFRSFRGGYNRGGILFRAAQEKQMQHISFIHLSIRNCTYSGISVSGATDLNVTGCDLNENGASVPSGPKLLHNLLLAHCSNSTIIDSRLDTSPNGSGISLDHCNELMISNCEIARNGYYGILIAESTHINLKESLIEANDRSGVMAEFLFRGNENISISNNRIQYNNGFGLEAYAVKNVTNNKNVFEGNGNSLLQHKISTEKWIVIEP